MRYAYVHGARGSVELHGGPLQEGDWVRVRDEQLLTLSKGVDAEVLVFDLRPQELPQMPRDQKIAACCCCCCCRSQACRESVREIAFAGKPGSYSYSLRSFDLPRDDAVLSTDHVACR